MHEVEACNALKSATNTRCYIIPIPCHTIKYTHLLKPTAMKLISFQT